MNPIFRTILASLLVATGCNAGNESGQQTLQYVHPAQATKQEQSNLVGERHQMLTLLAQQLQTTDVAAKIEHPEQKAAMIDKLLLYGPPGTGKTATIEDVAKKSGCNIVKLKGPAVVTQWLGSGAQSIRDAFNQAAQQSFQTNKPTIVFIDEVDAFVMGNDEKFRTEHQAALQTLWLCMDHQLCKSGVIVPVFATNKDITKFPDAFKNRFSHLNTIEFKNPDVQLRTKVLTHYLQQANLLFDSVLITELAKKSNGMSIRQLEYTVKDFQLTLAMQQKTTLDRATALQLLLENKRKTSVDTSEPFGKWYDKSVITNIQRVLTTSQFVHWTATIGAFGLSLLAPRIIHA